MRVDSYARLSGIYEESNCAPVGHLCTIVDSTKKAIVHWLGTAEKIHNYTTCEQ